MINNKYLYYLPSMIAYEAGEHGIDTDLLLDWINRGIEYYFQEEDMDPNELFRGDNWGSIKEGYDNLQSSLGDLGRLRDSISDALSNADDVEDSINSAISNLRYLIKKRENH